MLILTLNVLGCGGHIYWYQDLAVVACLPSQVLGDEAGEELHQKKPPAIIPASKQ